MVSVLRISVAWAVSPTTYVRLCKKCAAKMGVNDAAEFSLAAILNAVKAADVSIRKRNPMKTTKCIDQARVAAEPRRNRRR